MSSPATTPTGSQTPLPCVVQIGFSGSRSLYDRSELSAEEIARYDAAIQKKLQEVILSIRSKFGLGPEHFLVGISQIAIGADTLFTKCCGDAGNEDIVMQRILLPQPLDSYLTAIGSSGPDFSDEERQTAVKLVKRPSIVHIQCVSSAAERTERFEDALHGILAKSDIAICLVRAEAIGRPGGSLHFFELAKNSGKPICLIRVSIKDGSPCCEPDWKNVEKFQKPVLPELANQVRWARNIESRLPTSVVFCDALKAHYSPEARGARRRFERMARIILSTHVGATICATVAICAAFIHGPWAWTTLIIVLAVETALLLWGRRTHNTLHKKGENGTISQNWAKARLTAEIARSVNSLSSAHIYLSHLYLLRILPIPQLDRLVETINWLHLKATTPQRDSSTAHLSKEYISKRLDEQAAYLDREAEKSETELHKSHRNFHRWWAAGFAATLFKLIEVAATPYWHAPATMAALLGVAAVVCPLLAVAALAWASALDLEARASEFSEIQKFLEHQRTKLTQADSNREVRRLILETEAGLLGEVAQWYVRRSYAGVA